MTVHQIIRGGGHSIDGFVEGDVYKWGHWQRCPPSHIVSEAFCSRLCYR